MDLDHLSRRDVFRYGALGTGAIAGANLLAACGGSGSSVAGGGSGLKPSPGPSDAGTPVRGGTLVVGTLSNGSAETIDVRKAINIADFARSDNLLDPLFFQVPGGVAPGLATSAEPNAAADVWTFHLRKGVTFHNGKPFNADDVVYTINTWSTPDSSYAPVTEGLIDFKKVRKLDPYTVEVPLLRPMATFPAITSWYTAYIIPDGTTNFTEPIGTGPFRFGSFTPGSSSNFPANPDYWRGKPYVENLVVNSSFNEDAARVNAILGGQLDIAPGVPQALAKANASSGKLVLGNAPGPAYVAVSMRVNKPPFNDPRVVEAFKLVANRQQTVDVAFDGFATVGNDCPGATLEYFASDLKPEFDPEKAKSLLKAAGQEGISMPLLSSPTVPGLQESAIQWSNEAKAAGIDAPIKTISPTVYYTTTNPGYCTDGRPLSANYWGVFPASLGVYYLLTMGKAAIYAETAFGSKPGQEKLMNEAIGEVNKAKAQEKWQAVQEQQVKEGGNILLANFNFLDGYSPRVRGAYTNSANYCGNFEFYKAWLAS